MDQMRRFGSIVDDTEQCVAATIMARMAANGMSRSDLHQLADFAVVMAREARQAAT